MSELSFTDIRCDPCSKCYRLQVALRAAPISTICPVCQRDILAAAINEALDVDGETYEEMFGKVRGVLRRAIKEMTNGR